MVVSCSVVPGLQESESTRNWCAQTGGNRRIWQTRSESLVGHLSRQTILLWWWTNQCKYQSTSSIRDYFFRMNRFSNLKNKLCSYYLCDQKTKQLDVVSFAVLSQFTFISKEVNFPLRDYITEHCPNLIGHVSRIKERCFPDWDEICSKLDLNAHLPKPE